MKLFPWTLIGRRDIPAKRCTPRKAQVSIPGGVPTLSGEITASPVRAMPGLPFVRKRGLPGPASSFIISRAHEFLPEEHLGKGWKNFPLWRLDNAAPPSQIDWLESPGLCARSHSGSLNPCCLTPPRINIMIALR